MSTVKDYVSIPDYVSAAKVDDVNLKELAVWCGGEVVKRTAPSVSYIEVPTLSGTPLPAPIGSYLFREADSGKFRVEDADRFEQKYERDSSDEDDMEAPEDAPEDEPEDEPEEPVDE